MNALDLLKLIASVVALHLTNSQQITAMGSVWQAHILTHLEYVRIVIHFVRRALAHYKLNVQLVKQRIILEELIGVQIDAALDSMQIAIEFVNSAISIATNALVLQIINAIVAVQVRDIRWIQQHVRLLVRRICM